MAADLQLRALSDGEGDDRALVTLVETIEDLSSAHTVEQIAAVVRSAARRISGADGVTFVLRDNEQCWYLDEDAVGPLWKGQRFPLSACISGWAMLNGQTAVIPDIYKDDRVPHDAYRPTFVKSLVMTPVRARDPIAAIGAYWAERRIPTDAEVMNLHVMARATAAALESARAKASLTESLERRTFLLRELDHRRKNTLAAVRAIADQTLRNAASPAAFVDGFDARLEALARAHELLTRGSWGPSSLADIAGVAVQAFQDSHGDRITLGGPPIRLRPETALMMHMTLHELAVNAAMHGALSRPGGRVSLGWSVEMGAAPRRLGLVWKETGGPPPTEPEHAGFGRRLLEQGLARDLDGEARMLFEPDGLRYRLLVPLSDKVSLG